MEANTGPLPMKRIASEIRTCLNVPFLRRMAPFFSLAPLIRRFVDVVYY
jgi:hypothetical protein